MAFANLFAGLSSLDGDERSCGDAAPADTHCRNETGSGARGRKRKAQDEQTHPHPKMQRYQAQVMQHIESEHTSFIPSKKMKHGNRDKAGHNNLCQKGQNNNTRNNWNVNKQQQKNHHHHKDRGRPGRGGHQTRPPGRKGGWGGNNNHKQDLEVKRTRFMSQEFKDQNALLVDGRLLCRHFIWGRCIKGDDCQLEHAQGYNDLVKEVCKFYVQGCCTKGSSCPYMHSAQSFPCKFFHRYGKCSQGADCRFSHDPLNDTTNQLLNEVVKRDRELAKKAEQKGSEQPATADDSETAGASEAPDILLQPVRAQSFYNSADTNAETEAFLCQTEKLLDNMEEAITPQATDSAPPHSPPSSSPEREEPVCYSVEAVLGPQLSRPFPNFYGTPTSQESSSPSSSNCMLGSANQSKTPYSFHAILRSLGKPMETSTLGHTPSPPTALTDSYPPKIHSEEGIDLLLRPETPKEKVCLVSARNEANKPEEKQFQSLPALHVHTSQSCPGLAPPSGPHMNIPRSVKSTQRASKHVSQLKPHLPVLTWDSRASSRPICATSGFTKFRDKAAFPAEPVTSSIKLSDSANPVSCHFEAKQPTEIHLRSKTMQSGLKLGTKQHSDETTEDCSCKTAHCGGLAVGCKETQKSLFTSPITDTLQHTDDPETGSSIPQGLVQSSHPAPQSGNCTSNHVKSAGEPDTASARSFLSLFAAPLTEPPLPCVQSQPHHPSTSSCSQQSVQLGDAACHLSDAKQRASSSEKSTPWQVRSDVKEMSNAPQPLNSSPNPKIDSKDRSDGHRQQCPQQLVNPVCSLGSQSLGETRARPPESRSDQPQPNASSHKGPAAANSVLKTLFVCLSPYREDGEQEDRVETSAPPESEKLDRGSTACVFEKPQRKSKRKRRQKKKLKTQDSPDQSSELAAAPSARHHHLSAQTPHTGRSIPSSSGEARRQVRDSPRHTSPFRPAVQMLPAQAMLKHTLEERELVNGNGADTPFKDLFKPLDATVFHPGC